MEKIGFTTVTFRKKADEKSVKLQRKITLNTLSGAEMFIYLLMTVTLCVRFCLCKKNSA